MSPAKHPGGHLGRARALISRTIRLASKRDGGTDDSLEKWREAAARTGADLLPPRLPASKSRTGFADTRIGDAPADLAAFARTAPADRLLGLIDNLIHTIDLKSLMTLQAAIEIAPVRDYLYCRLLARHQCYEPALAAAQGLLERLQAVLAEPAATRWRHEVIAIAAQCAMTLGRAGEAHAWIDKDPTFKAARQDAVLQILWRNEPRECEALAARLAFGASKRANAAVLFSYLPLLSGDIAGARGNLNIQYHRQAGLGRHVSSELLLCDAAISVAEHNTGRASEAYTNYFESFGLSSPLKGPFDSAQLFFDQLENASVGSSSNGPLVTVIMTAHNSAQTIGYALASLRSQSHGNLEIIVVDDASTDSTPSLLSDAVKSDTRIVPLRSERNIGTYASKNRALRIAQGKYFTCLDSDDWAHPKRIEMHVDLMEANPKIVASESDWIRITADGASQLRRTAGGFRHPNPASPFYRRQEVVDAIGFYDRVMIDADIEQGRRVLAHFGPAAKARLHAPLTLGFHRPESLMRKGLGAMSDEYYSEIRSEYRFAALQWRMRNAGRSMFFSGDEKERPFPAPPDMLVPE
jgi:hypothetical protein